MCPKYLSLATFAYNTLNTPNLVNFSLYELVFGRKPKVHLNLETTPDIKIAGTFKITIIYYIFITLWYVHKCLKDFKSKRLAMINKN